MLSADLLRFRPRNTINWRYADSVQKFYYSIKIGAIVSTRNTSPQQSHADAVSVLIKWPTAALYEEKDSARGFIIARKVSLGAEGIYYQRIKDHKSIREAAYFPTIKPPG